MPLPAFRSAGTITTALTGAAMTPAAPAGIDDLDVLFAVVSAETDTAGAYPSITANSTGWQQAAQLSSTRSAALWWYRVSGSAPTMPTFDYTPSNTTLIGQIFAFSGVKTTSNPWQGGIDISNRGAGTTIIGGPLIASEADSLGVHIWVIWDDTGTGSTNNSWVEQSEVVTTVGLDTCIALDTKALGVGTEPAPTRTIATSESSQVIRFVLLPGPAAPSRRQAARSSFWH